MGTNKYIKVSDANAHSPARASARRQASRLSSSSWTAVAAFAASDGDAPLCPGNKAQAATALAALAMLAAAGFMAQEAVTGKTWGSQDVSFEKLLLGGYFAQESAELARDAAASL